MAQQLELMKLIQTFVDVALSDPLSFLFVIMGALIVGGTSLVLGYLSLGGLLSWLSPGPGQGPPRQAR